MTLLTCISIFTAITLPFQKSIIKEDNPIILAIFEKSNFRKVFIDAIVFQYILIIICVLAIIICSNNSLLPKIRGGIELFIICLLFSEFIALISNGLQYNKFQEKMLVKIRIEGIK